MTSKGTIRGNLYANSFRLKRKTTVGKNHRGNGLQEVRILSWGFLASLKLYDYDNNG
jgi:hypothetical protein